jgi:pimeloyl-ACP methyl ester carboxylesterase
MRLSLLSILAVTTLVAACASPTGGLAVREVGSFYVGGRSVTLSGLPEKELHASPGAPPIHVNPNGDFEVDQMYVRYTKLAAPKAKYPLLLWHGGGLTGVTFETKPDGQPGWEDFFLAAGHDVYVSDAVERGRASWARYPEIYKTDPFFRTKKEAWELFRIGNMGSYSSDPAKRTTWPGSQFPTASFDEFMKQSVPRWTSNDDATQRAYDQYVEKVCPCVILVHSQGGAFAFNSALKYPDKVKAIVAVETSGTPDLDKIDYSRLKHTPFLWVWGDNLDKYSFWVAVRKRQEEFRSRIVAAGGVGDEIDLPKMGLHGDSHMMMMDRDSDQIATRIQDWLARQGLMR